jgi:hypothetical protein
MAIAIVVALAALPIVFITAGFIAASTLLFGVTATALRGQRPSTRALAFDLAVGAAFSIVLFVTFTRGLGVSLPGVAGF